MEYQVIRSSRRTVGLEVGSRGVVVRAPFWVPDSEIEEFVRSRQSWLEKKLALLADRQKEQKTLPPLSEAEIRALAAKALEVIPARVAWYAPKIGVTYGRITIRSQRTRWGSCSSKGNLNFNCLLMLAPPEVLDSVVVHELCHRKEMNHSDRFYAQVLRVFPDYWTWHKWLSDHGDALIARMPG